MLQILVMIYIYVTLPSAFMGTTEAAESCTTVNYKLVKDR